MKKGLVWIALVVAIGSAHAEFDLGASLQKSFDKALVKNGFKQADSTPTAPAASPATQTSAAVKNGDLFGKVFKAPYDELAKSFKIARGLSFGAPGKMVLAFDLSNKTGRRVLVLKQQSAEQWLVTGDRVVSTLTNGLVFVGTAEEDDTGDGDPKTTCFVGGKEVQAIGFMKASKGKFDQPDGALAWTVDGRGTPSVITKLACKY